MAYTFNVFTGQLDAIGSGGGSAFWADPVNTFSDLPTSDQGGTSRVVKDQDAVYTYDANSTTWIFSGAIKQADVGSTPNSQGYSVDFENTLTLQPADETNPGIITTADQTFAGTKTLVESPIIENLNTNSLIFTDINSAVQTDPYLNYDGTNVILNLVDNYGGLKVKGRSGGEASFSLQPDNVGDGNAGQWIFYTNGSQLNDQTDFAMYNSGLGSPTIILQASTGNVGIGTNDPSTALDVSGTVTATGGSLTGALDMNSNLVNNVTDPVSAQDAATKNYTDTTFIPLAEIGAANGVAPLDSSSKIPLTYLPASVFIYQGTWDPTTNTPTLIDGTGTTGFVYWVNAVAAGPIVGLTNPSMINFEIGDLVIYNGTQYELTTPAAGVQSVNGMTGAVTVNAINELTGDITAGPASESESVASTVAKIQGTTVSGTTGTGNVVFSASPSFTGTPVSASNISTPGIFYPFGPALSTQDGRMTDSGGVTKIDWVNGKLVDSANATQVTWSTSGVELNQLTASTVPVLDGSKILQSSSVTSTELAYLSKTLNSSFTGANNVASAADVTGFAFSNSTIRGFRALATVTVSATSSLYEEFELYGIQRGSDWSLAIESNGDNSQVVFSITTSGQIQYTSANYTGFSSLTVKFRAEATPV